MQRLNVLVLGPENSGKTLLTKCLQYYSLHDRKCWQTGDIPSHVSTVGVNMVEIKSQAVSSSPSTSKDANSAIPRKIYLREVGGSVGPLWPSYYDDVQAVLFVVDSSAPFQIAASTVLLMDCMSDDRLSALPFLLVFAKRDVQECVSLQQQKDMMMLDKLTTARPTGKLDVLDCSAINGAGIGDLYKWIEALV